VNQPKGMHEQTTIDLNKSGQIGLRQQYVEMMPYQLPGDGDAIIQPCITIAREGGVMRVPGARQPFKPVAETQAFLSRGLVMRLAVVSCSLCSQCVHIKASELTFMAVCYCK